ncbi:hypothetical protein Tco_0943493, partial [Tanacetum coccineum]
SEDALDVVEIRRCTVEVDFKTEYESNDDSHYQSDKSVDYLSPVEDELIKLRNRMKANRKAKAKAITLITNHSRMWQLTGLPCVHATKRGQVRDEGASGTKGGAIGSKGRGGRGGAAGR